MSLTVPPTIRSASIGKSERRPLGGLPSTTLSLGNAIYRPASLEGHTGIGPSGLGSGTGPGSPRNSPAAAVAPTPPSPGARHKSNTGLPFGRLLAGKCGMHVPMVTFVATLLSLSLYTLVAVLLWSTSCPWNKNQVGHLFAFCVYAIISSIIMLAINCIYSHYRYNCLSLTVSLLYSGSATLVAYKLILALFQGLCQPRGTPSGSFLVTGHAGNWVIWFAGAAAVGFQVVAHYYYG